MKDETSGNAPPPPLSPTLIFPHKQGKQKLLSRRSPPLPPPSPRRRRRRVRSAFVALPFPFFLRCCHLSMHKKKERKVSPAQEMPDVGGFRKVPREVVSPKKRNIGKTHVFGSLCLLKPDYCSLHWWHLSSLPPLTRETNRARKEREVDRLISGGRPLNQTCKESGCLLSWQTYQRKARSRVL